MEPSSYSIGQAVFIRTDTPDYQEDVIAFKDLKELVEVCSKSRTNMVLEKVIIYSMADNEPCALTLGFVSATKGQRPGNIPELEKNGD